MGGRRRRRRRDRRRAARGGCTLLPQARPSELRGRRDGPAGPPAGQRFGRGDRQHADRGGRLARAVARATVQAGAQDLRVGQARPREEAHRPRRDLLHHHPQRGWRGRAGLDGRPVRQRRGLGDDPLHARDHRLVGAIVEGWHQEPRTARPLRVEAQERRPQVRRRREGHRAPDRHRPQVHLRPQHRTRSRQPRRTLRAVPAQLELRPRDEPGRLLAVRRAWPDHRACRSPQLLELRGCRPRLPGARC